MIGTLIELQRLKSLDRTGWVLRGLPPGTESVASHSFGVGVTVMFLADRLVAGGTHVDIARLLRMALLHDWAEARIGDMPRTGTRYFGQEARRDAELKAFADIVEGTALNEIYVELFDDYEQRATLEARLVKAADVIDLLVQVLALERAGYRGLDEFWEVTGAMDFRLDGVAHDLVSEMIDHLLTARADVLARNI
ncbi:MAG TPA: HD family hydrolase [Pyrinomonadaceae bacterium]|nr:HD family hydrolase [Pyrinomonadaceae bacterium]